MRPLKREQATRVSYNMLTHSGLYCRDTDREKKVGHELNSLSWLAAETFEVLKSLWNITTRSPAAAAEIANRTAL